MSKKIVLQAQLNCEKCKQRAMKMVAGIEGVHSIDVDVKNNKITVVGDADPVCLIAGLRKFGSADLVSVGPSKLEPEKKPEKKPEPVKPDKKPAKDEDSKHNITYVVVPASCDRCSGYTYYLSDENPNACAIL